MNTQKEINKYVKEKDEKNMSLFLNTIVDNIKSIDNFSLLCQTLVKNVKNDNNSLLFANLLLHFSDKVKANDIDQEIVYKLYGMSLKSQLPAVRIFVLLNLKRDLANESFFEAQISELRNAEKNEKVLEVLNSI